MPKAKAEGGRKKKDPNAPKKALGAYMFFCKDRRESLKEEFPDLTMTEQASKLGALWKEMDEEARKPYAAKAEADKERYAKEMEAYKA